MEWDSPRTTITDGLQIKYAYSPDYMLKSNMLGRTNVASSGWFVDYNNFLCFITVSETLTADPTLLTDNQYADLDDNEYFYVSKSSKWNGIHKMQDDQGHGILQTYTKVSRRYNTGELSETSTDCEIVEKTGEAGAAGGYLTAADGTDVFVNLMLSVGDFVYITYAVSGDNGVYEVTSITETDGGLETTQKVYLGKKYFLNPEDTIEEFQSGTDHFATDAAVTVYKINFDPCYMSDEVDVLDSEADEIDLPSYLTKALVYYVKSKIAEDAGNFEVKQYMQREFRKMVEKYETTRISGPRMISAGSHAIR